jgi:hypothetical protein
MEINPKKNLETAGVLKGNISKRMRRGRSDIVLYYSNPNPNTESIPNITIIGTWNGIISISDLIQINKHELCLCIRTGRILQQHEGFCLKKLLEVKLS